MREKWTEQDKRNENLRIHSEAGSEVETDKVLSGAEPKWEVRT